MILLLQMSGCGMCDYETRDVVSTGSLTEGMVEIVRADVSVGANRGGLQWRSVDWVVTGASLEGHVTSMALVNSAPPHDVLIDLPLNHQPEGYISISRLIQYEGDLTPSLGGLFEIVAANRAALEIRTDLPARPLVRIPLSPIAESGWIRPNHCF